jgi:hypothetical protein
MKDDCSFCLFVLSEVFIFDSQICGIFAGYIFIKHQHKKFRKNFLKKLFSNMKISVSQRTTGVYYMQIINIKKNVEY